MLNHRQKRFARFYAINLCGTKSAILAGYAKSTAHAQASRLLRNVNIRSEIALRIEELEEIAGVNDQSIMEELATVAFSDPRDYFDPDGNLLPVPELSELAAKALASFKVTTHKDGTITTEIKRENKLHALETLARIRNMFKDASPHNDVRERVIYYPVKVDEGAPVDLTARIEPKNQLVKKDG